jgi:hypothetical protein
MLSLSVTDHTGANHSRFDPVYSLNRSRLLIGKLICITSVADDIGALRGLPDVETT